MADIQLPTGWTLVEASTQEEVDVRLPPVIQPPPRSVVDVALHLKGLRGPVDLLRVTWPGLATPGTKAEPHKVDVLRGGYWEGRDVFYKGFVNHSDMNTVGHVIVSGGEHPVHPDWVRRLRDQCQAANVPFAFLGWGEYRPCEGNEQNHPNLPVRFVDYRKECGYYCDESIGHVDHRTVSVIRVGSAHSGRLLDGRVWDEQPEGVRDEVWD